MDGLNEALPRRWKRKVGIVVLVAFTLFPSQARDAVIWYGQERGKQIVERLIPLVTPTDVTTPSSPPSPKPSALLVGMPSG